jgi:CubicO group peptidase (beta-lactamase class C family)
MRALSIAALRLGLASVACLSVVQPLSVAADAPWSMTTQLEEIRRQHHLPALAVAVIHGQKTEVAVVGFRKWGNPTRVTVDDRFHLGSCGKAMAATLVGMLVEDGRLKWDTTIATVFPELVPKMRPEYRSVTLEQLLLHRAGLPAQSWPEGKTLQDMHRLAGSPMHQRRIYLQLSLRQKPAARPGAKHIYTNAGYAIAGAMVERVTSTPWEKLMRQRLLGPLGMKTAGFGPMGTPRRVDQPWQHTVEAGKLRPIEPRPENDNPVVLTPAGRLHCSMADWAWFVGMHLRGARGEPSLLQPATFRKLHTPPFGGEYGSGTGVAFGWVRTNSSWGGRIFAYDGSNTQNFALVLISPERNFAVMAATNQGGGSAPKACDQVTQALIKHLLPPNTDGSPPRDQCSDSRRRRWQTTLNFR